MVSGEWQSSDSVFEQRTFVAFLISGSIYGDCAPRALVCIYIYNRACASVVYLVQRDLSLPERRSLPQEIAVDLVNGTDSIL